MAKATSGEIPKSFADIISKIVGKIINIAWSFSSLLLVTDVLWKIG